MTITAITSLLITIIPSAGAIIMSIVSLFTLIRKFAALKNDVNTATKTKEYEALNTALAQENAALRKDIKDLIDTIKNVKTKEV